MSGEKLNGSVIKVSPSKTPIVPINRDFMPRDERELERCERTVYVNQIDRAVPGSAVEAMFENTCGATPRSASGAWVRGDGGVRRAWGVCVQVTLSTSR